jgi:hypothetical protein
MMELANDLAFKVLCNRTAAPFVISDHPAVRYNQFLETRKPSGSNTGIAILGLQFFLPIGPRHVIVLFDSEVYKVGGRRLDSYRVEIEDEREVRALNVLQAANAGEWLYSGDGVNEHEARRLARKGAAIRPSERTRFEVFQPAASDRSNPGELQRWFRPDIRAGLSLSCIRLTPYTEQYDLGDRVINYRDPGLVKLHERYREEIDHGTREYGSFGQLPKAPKPDSATRVCIKSDVMIVAAAKVAGATTFYSHEERVRRYAGMVGMVGKDLPLQGSHLFTEEEMKLPKKSRPR